MTYFILAYLAGLLTLATPCIFPILPFVLARADRPFRQGGLPMLLGLAFGFAGVASLAAFAGNWAVTANHHGRLMALTLMTLFGVTMLFPALATRLAAPIVLAGSRLMGWTGHRVASRGAAPATSTLLGIATGLVWAPCAGPILGLILTGAALRGPGIETSLLLLTYGLGAATALAASLLLSGRLFAFFKLSVRHGDGLRRIAGAAVIAGAALVWAGIDTGLLTRWSAEPTNAIEQRLMTALQNEDAMNTSTASAADPEPVLSGPLASLLEAQQWLNTPPLRPEDLRGKVVLVNFWTYSCINCLRALPHVRAWAETYKDRGLVVIGVHTPEFAFEKDAANVAKAASALGIGYPVAIDNDFGIWRAFGNRAWPALYFIGADGRIEDYALGEGNYEQSERLIQHLLSEANGVPVTSEITAVAGEGPQAAADERNLRSGETYTGYANASNFASPGGIRHDAPRLYQTAAQLPLNYWSLAGTWVIGGEFATLDAARGSISYRFHARDLHLVMAPARQDHPIRFRVTIDGAAPGDDHGADIDADGWGTLKEDRLYQLVRQTGPIADRTFEIQFHDAGARIYAFTFG